MNKRRKLVIAFGAGALAAPLVSFAQQQGKMWRVGLLYNGSRQSAIDTGRYPAFIEGMRKAGYIEGQNLVIEARFADVNDDLRAVGSEILKSNPDLVVTSGALGAHALLSLRNNTPIVVVVSFDAVREGFAVSLARPGGSVTGLSALLDDVFAKHVELLKLAIPKLTRIAVLALPGNLDHLAVLKSIEANAQLLGVGIIRVDVDAPKGFEAAFQTIARERAEALIVLGSTYFVQHFREIAALALKSKVASTYSGREYPEVGGLMSYGPNFADSYRRAAAFVDKILKGAKPGELPFEQPAQFYLTINRTTANALGVKITGELLMRVDNIIE